MPPNPCDIPVIGQICGVPGQAAASLASSAWDGIVGSFADGVGQATRLLFTFWTKIPSPDVAQPGGPAEFIRSSTSWYAGALAVGAFLVAAARIALTRRGDQAALLAQGMVRLVAATFLGVPVVSALLAAGDGYSDWILQRAAGGDFGGRIVAGVNVASLLTQGVGSALVLLFAIVGLGAAIGQMALMFVRAGMVTLLVGLLPLSASVSNTDAGKQWFDRTNGWLLAFVLYKPAAATVYAAALVSIGKSDDVMGIVSGVFLLVLAVLTLPALMRLAVPATAAAAAGGGGGAGAAAAGVLATGAVLATGGRSGMGGGSPAGAGSGGGLREPSGATAGGSAAGGGRGGAPAPAVRAQDPAGEPVGAAAAGGGAAGGTAGRAAGGAASGAAAGGPAVMVIGAAAQAGQAAVEAGREAGQGAAGEDSQ